MSDYTCQNNGNEVNMNQRACFKQCLHNLNQLNSDNLITVTDYWTRIYGKDESTIAEKTTSVEKALAQFWEFQVDHLEERKKNLLKSIEKTAKEAFELEKALGIDGGMNRSIEDCEVPLVEWEEQVWKQLSSYQDLKQQRIEEYSKLLNTEKMLCEILGESPLFPAYIEHLESTSVVMGLCMNFPTNEVMEKCEERVKQLAAQRDQLEYDFEMYKEELRNLLRECELPPLNKPECFACSSEEDETFKHTHTNLNKLKASTEHHRQKKQQMIDEADRVREEIIALSKKMLKDPQELENFISEHDGFTKPIIEKLKEKLKAMKEERKIKLKDLILGYRNLLDDLWTRCCFSDDQKAQFRAYSVNHYTEEVLTFHELEVEEVEQFYADHKRIFQLADKFKELWDRLLQLESQSSQSDRLFNNRGGRLLQEEKERKLIQKKVPAIKSELEALLNDYKAKTGNEFLVFGEPLREQLRQMEEDREASKENKKLMRVLLRSETNDQARAPALTPGRAVGGYATLRTPSQKTTARTPAARTPAASTPENGSPSYESFQEHIQQFNVKEICHSSMKNPSSRILRPRNHNETITIRCVTPGKTPYKTPKTPVKTPSKIPFRIATGSKIPSTVPPISPRSASKLTTPRSKLPLIF